MVCEKCGETMAKGIKFCTKCGANMKGAAPPGKGILKVTGILIIVFGVLGLISELVLLFVENPVVAALEIPIIITILGFAGTIFSLAIGVLGVKYCKNIEKAKLLLQLAIIFIICIPAISIYTAILLQTGFQWMAIFSFIFPVIYLIGAYKNYKAKRGEE